VIARAAPVVLPGSTGSLASYCLHSVDGLAGSTHHKTIAEILLDLLKLGGKRNKRPMMHACQALIATAPESLAKSSPCGLSQFPCRVTHNLSVHGDVCCIVFGFPAMS
jgi:hypothetical protein